jgi:hypothetical protein
MGFRAPEVQILIFGGFGFFCVWCSFMLKNDKYRGVKNFQLFSTAAMVIVAGGSLH